MAGMRTSRTSTTREILALLTTGIAYWLTIYPQARREIRRWKNCAQQIPDPILRAHALQKLTSERLNPEAAAFFAVLAPVRRRSTLVRLMVAYQIAYDYLDALNEPPDGARLLNGLQLHTALRDAVSQSPEFADYYQHHPQANDGGYLPLLVRACRVALSTLPSASQIEPILQQAADRCGQSQSRNHATLVEGDLQLISWAETLARGSGYRWWELAAGGISCLALHALFAAAASTTTLTEANSIDAVYFPPICAISALLDSLIDYAADATTVNHSFVRHYATSTYAAERFAAIMDEARVTLRALACHRRHAVILSGIACFYLSADEAHTAFARPISTGTLAGLGPITVPMLSVIRLMRCRLRSKITTQ
jgi:tetraprenyl-beta-curcumene synthase